MSEIINLNDTTPAADPGYILVKWKKGTTPAGVDPTTGYSFFDTSAEVPIGGGLVWVEEIQTGTMNGINKVFTLSFTPTAGSLTLVLNIPQVEGTDFTIATNTITYTVAPKATDAGWHQARYQH
jgi:hypothetical protein